MRLLRSNRRLSSVVLATIAGLAVIVAVPRAQAPATPPGNGTLYIGGYPNQIWIIDEASKNITHTIETKIGLPRGMQISRDLERIYVANIHSTEIEIIDLETKQSLDVVTLTEGNRRTRINSFTPDPTHASMVMITRDYIKHIDRYEIGPAKLVQYDMATRKVTRTIPWPDGEERDSANLLFSPDGKYLYFLGGEILVFETTNFTEVDRWNLSSTETGTGSLSLGTFGGVDTVADEPGFYTTTVNVEDPLNSRRMMGVARVNLSAKTLDYYTIGPAGGVSFALSPDGKHAYGLESEIGRYQFWTFDLPTRRVTKRQEFAGRPRMGLKTSSNGKVLYIYVAGNTIDSYDAETYAHMSTLHLPGDMSTGLFVLPARGE